jgi:hypothetical protein
MSFMRRNCVDFFAQVLVLGVACRGCVRSTASGVFRLCARSASVLRWRSRFSRSLSMKALMLSVSGSSSRGWRSLMRAIWPRCTRLVSSVITAASGAGSTQDERSAAAAITAPHHPSRTTRRRNTRNCAPSARVSSDHVDGVREFSGRIAFGVPHQAQAIAVHRALACHRSARDRQRAFEDFGAGASMPPPTVGSIGPSRRHELPVPFGMTTSAYRPLPGTFEARVRWLLADVERAVAQELDAGRIGGAHSSSSACAGCCAPFRGTRVQRVAGERQEGEQTHSWPRQQLARDLQGARAASVSRTTDGLTSSNRRITAQPSLRGIAKR